VEKAVGQGPGTKTIGDAPFTPRAKKVLQLAVTEAQSLNHTYVGTEHILLGLLHEGEGYAAQVLRNLDVDLERTRVEVMKELDPNFEPRDTATIPSSAGSGTETKKGAPGEVKTPALNAFGRDLTELARRMSWTR
jgi:ATP-dependent Clp protease ATP-binding subunit ClpC